jgi:murein L,D-transpeptidase YcbB/YkuD
MKEYRGVPGYANRKMLVVIVFCLAGLFSGGKTFAQGLTDQMAGNIRERFTFSTDPQQVVCRGEFLCGSLALSRFYSLRNFAPAWISDQGVKTDAYHLVQAIKDAGSEGLSPQGYHLDVIEELLQEIEYLKMEASEILLNTMGELDLLLSDAFFLFASHFSNGRVNPETIDPEWSINTHKVDLIQLANHALEHHTIKEDLNGLLPQDEQYSRLKKAFAAYRKITEEGGWPAVSNGPTIRKGDQGGRVAELRVRLVHSGDMNPTYGSYSKSYGKAMEQAVLNFQKRHGLATDGVVGPATLSALNVPAEDRVKQIQVNMERLRWFPRDLCKRHMLVNIAEFQLKVMDNDTQVLKMRVVVGKDYRRTPEFTGQMSYMVLNPFWRIPHKLAVEDFLPRIRTDKDFFKRQQIRVFENWKAGAPEIDPDSVNWNQMNKKNFSYKLVQDPGPFNALGNIKFMFPNKFSVYLHDTPAKHLFEQKKRNLSSGCIRIENPVDLAAYLVRDESDWTREKILETIMSRETKVIRILRPIPIHVLYSTSWVEADGTVQFREDLYGRDRLLYAALKEPIGRQLPNCF